MRKLGSLCFLLIGSSGFAASGEGGGCFYDGKLYSEGALISIKAPHSIVIQCERRQPPKEGGGFFWRMLGTPQKPESGSTTGKK